MVTAVANKFFGPSSVDTSLLLSGHWPATQRTLACSSADTGLSAADPGPLFRGHWPLLSGHWPAPQRTLARSSADTGRFYGGSFARATAAVVLRVGDWCCRR